MTAGVREQGPKSHLAPDVGAELDPADWQDFRRIGRELIDEAFGWLETLPERPVWQPVPRAVRERLQSGPPETGGGIAAALEEFRRDVLPHPLGNGHPRFWGWVIGSGDPVGVLAELLAAVMNPNLFAGDHSASFVEAQVLRWSRTMLGLPEHGSGLLTNGCSSANLMGLILAREAKCGIDWDGAGLAGARRLPVLYCSEETHNSVDKAAKVMGLGSASVRRLPALEYALDVEALDSAIADDLREGHLPFCVVANVGTVNTGAIDPLDDIADICSQKGLWLHIDGAFGALAALTPEYAPRLVGLARGDSLAFDFHKWMYAPYSVGCLLTKDPEVHAGALHVPGAYLASDERGIMSGPSFASLGMELGRDFRALKIWLALKAHGRSTFARLIARNIAQARYLAERVEATDGIELAAPVSLNIVCLRATAPGLAEEGTDALNREIMLRVQESGVAVISSTRLSGRFVLRVAITNHRSRTADFDLLVEEVLRQRDAILVADKSASETASPVNSVDP